MKKLIFISILISLSSMIYCQGFTDILNILRGVKSEIRNEFNFEQIFGEWKEIPGKEKIHFQYDKKGNLIDESKYDSKGTLISKSSFKYDKNKNRIEQMDYLPDGSLKYQIMFKYDTNGNMVEESKYDADGWKLYTKKNYVFAKYNSRGQVVEETKYDSDRLLKSKITYNYDSLGNLSESSKFGLMKSKITNRYDIYGNITEELKYDSEGILTTQSISEFDSIGNHIAWSMFDPDGELASISTDDLYLKDYSRWIGNYDINGNPIEKLFYDSDENLKQKFVYNYSANRDYEYVVYAYEYKFGEIQEIPVKKFTFEYEEY